MYCPNCGAFNDKTYNNCTSCGKYIADINKEIMKKEKATSEIQASEPVSSEVKEISVKPVSIAENTQTGTYNGSTERKYSESIYRQNIKKPKDYFVFSLICAILGSLSLGIASIIFSAMTKSENVAGNIDKAKVYSERTKIFCILSAVIGVLKYIFIIGIMSYYYAMTKYFGPYFW